MGMQRSRSVLEWLSKWCLRRPRATAVDAASVPTANSFTCTACQRHGSEARLSSGQTTFRMATSIRPHSRRKLSSFHALDSHTETGMYHWQLLTTNSTWQRCTGNEHSSLLMSTGTWYGVLGSEGLRPMHVVVLHQGVACLL